MDGILGLQAMDGARSVTTDSRMKLDLGNALDARRRLMLTRFARTVQAVKSCEHAAAKNGLRPVMEIPIEAYVSWAAKFKTDALESGITDFSGYECWAPDSDFYKWWKKKNAELQYRESQRCKNSSIVVPATRWSKLPERSAA